MILGSLYSIAGAVLIVVGIVAEFLGYSAGLAGVYTGVFCLGVGELYNAIGCIAKNTDRANELLAQAQSRPMPGLSAICTELADINAAMKKSNQLLAQLVKATAPLGLQTQPAKAGDERFYYSDAQMQAHGPVSMADLKNLLRQGRIQPTTPIAQDGTDEWILAEQWPELANSRK
ncbi:MAG TPA: DUF4339 domain-containing protein [Chthoniobacteraceae bacterium]|nr:DUF4339 domain-containing protein [Chthoniobacteraceae bacterium]